MAVVENEHGYVEGGSMDGPRLAPYPGYVQTVEERRRWDAAYGIAEGVSAMYERDGDPDPRFTWLATRALYQSELPTADGDLAEAARELEAYGQLLDGDPDFQVSASDRAAELIAAAEASREYGAHDLAADFSVEALETLFGNVDGLPDEIDEAIGIPHAYDAGKHPRGRGGKWLAKLGGTVRQLGPAPHPSVEHAMINSSKVHERTMGGPAMHTDARKLDKTGRMNEDVQRIAKHTGQPVGHVKVTVQRHQDSTTEKAKDYVAKKGLRGGVGVGTAQAAIHHALTTDNVFDKHAEHHHALGGRRNEAIAMVHHAASQYFPDPRDTAAGKMPGTPGIDLQDDVDKTHEFFSQSVEVARWAHEHQDAIRLAGHVIHHTARAFGLAAARVDDE